MNYSLNLTFMFMQVKDITKTTEKTDVSCENMENNLLLFVVVQYTRHCALKMTATVYYDVFHQ